MYPKCAKILMLLGTALISGSLRDTAAQMRPAIPAPAVLSSGASTACPTAPAAPHPLSGPQAVTLGTYAQFTGSQASSNQPLIWSVNGVPGGDAYDGAISATGLYTAPLQAPSCPTVVISAFNPAQPRSSQSLAITLAAAPSGPAPIPTVVSTDPMGIVMQNPHIIGRDGTWSALIDGKSYWSFNDTSMNAYNAEGQNFISNTRSWTDSLDASNGIYLNHDHLDSIGMPTEFMPFTATETAFNAAHGDKSGCSTTTDPLCGESYAIWPGPIIPVPNSGTGEAYHFYDLILRGGPIVGWEFLGVGIAHEQNHVFTRPILTPGSTYPTLMWQASNGSATPTTYGGGGMLQGNMVYMTGCDLQVAFGYHSCSIARVPLSQILNQSAWTYYNGTTWTTNPAQAASLFIGGASGNTLIFNPALNEYMTIYPELYTNETGFRVAPTPWGPWSAEQNLFEGVPTIGANGANDYATQPHPEFQQQNGLVQYVTYVQDDTDLGFVGQNIQLVRVTFAPPTQ
jgi:hypothetical protein